jgi:hypothetical protein
MSKGNSKTVGDIVHQIMTRGLGDGHVPHAYKRQIEAQKAFIEMFFDEVLCEIGRGNKVRIKNFGVFDFRVIKGPVKNFARGSIEEARNPRRIRVNFSKNTVSVINREE